MPVTALIPGSTSNSTEAEVFIQERAHYYMMISPRECFLTCICSNLEIISIEFSESTRCQNTSFSELASSYKVNMCLYGKSSWTF